MKASKAVRRAKQQPHKYVPLTEAMEIAYARKQKRSVAATDDQLLQIWPAWNALPAEMPPEEKELALTSPRDAISDFSAHRAKDGVQTAVFDRNEFFQAFEKVRRWCDLVELLKSTEDAHRDLVERQWAFNDADAHATSRIAILRAALELRLLRPGLLECERPSLADIALLDTRFRAYQQAREEALKALDDLVFRHPGVRGTMDVPLRARAAGVPRPPSNVSQIRFIARLDALGVCSASRLEAFLRTELPELKRSERQEFYRLSLSALRGKNPYASLRVWLLDNRPIFEHPLWGWQWKDIQNVVEQIGIDHPRTSLKQWSSSNRLRLRLKRGATKVDARAVVSTRALLSPVPTFDALLKNTSG